MRWPSRIALLLIVGSCGGNSPPDASVPLRRCVGPIAGSKMSLQKLGTVVSGAMLVTAPRDDLRLFVIEQRGAIRIFKDQVLLPDPFLDLSPDAGGPVIAGGENGLLGLAFHPGYASNGQFFVYYTARNTGDPDNPQRNVVARCQVSATNPDRADSASCTDVLSIPDFAGNHNGGMIEFGRDGYLYIGTGDGGGGGDPMHNGRALNDGDPMPNTKALLGKILRIDIDSRGAGEYDIPADNPFAAGGGKPEIFVIGLRNPWRWSFDRETGDLWIGDVGQGAIEELTVLRAGEQAGKDLGWSTYEGSICYREPCGAGTIAPQDERTHNDGWLSIIGGQVYRGTCYPDLTGTYFYTDYNKGQLVTATLAGNGSLAITDLSLTIPAPPASLHEDGRGELYVTDTAGNVYHLEAGP
ncbi:MAG TPA: PQQ-dependent sugar dehydrogenase [Kofleriaceae bacterium]